MATIETSVKEIVTLFCDPDDAVSEEASKALLKIGELALEPLTGVILRPISPIHRIKAIFAIKFIRPRKSLAAQLALIKLENSKDKPLADLASSVLFQLTLDEVESKSMESRRPRTSSEGPAHTTTGSDSDPPQELVNQRLSELRSQE
jgi:hypothetical protein